MRVLLLTPSTYGYEVRTREAVARVGHDVEWMDERIGNDVLSKVATRIGLLRFVPRLLRRHVDQIIEKAAAFGAKRLLVVNPESLKGPDFAHIRAQLPELDIVIYRWDSMRQKPVDEETMSIASAVYSFDPDDCANNPNLRHLPLFHSHTAPPAVCDSENAEYRFSFVGTAHLRRVQILGRLCRILDQDGSPYFFHLTTQSHVHQVLFWLAARFWGYRGTLTRTRVPYERYLEVVASSAAVVDIEFKRQSGLTMRTMEVVFSGMPLLTTNPSIMQYDFSVDAPVFVFEENTSALPDVTGFQGAGVGAYFEKYAIDTWARTLMDKDQGTYFRTGKPHSM